MGAKDSQGAKGSASLSIRAFLLCNPTMALRSFPFRKGCEGEGLGSRRARLAYQR